MRTDGRIDPSVNNGIDAEYAFTEYAQREAPR